MERKPESPERPCIIAIDGPAASGKSTVAAQVADRLGFLFVDSGSMYRAVTLLALEEDVPVEDEAALVEIARRVRRGYSVASYTGGAINISIEGRDVTESIRLPAVGDSVSRVSAVSGVREEMVSLQREVASGMCAVVEGRDIGTTVFPDACLKIYLEASAGERARRRKRELDDRGISITHREVEEEIAMRDSVDSTREESPLARASDAVVIDTNNIAVPSVVDRITAAFEHARRPRSQGT